MTRETLSLPTEAAGRPLGGDPMYVVSDGTLSPAYVPFSKPCRWSPAAAAGPMYVECPVASIVVEPKELEPEPRPRRRRVRHGERRRRCQLQIATHLRELELEDPSRVLLLRQINRLGFESPELLRAHYERYGRVAKVLVSNTREKDDTLPYPVRVRPSGIGFIIMESPDAAAAALSEGPEQTIHGARVKVLKFLQRPQCGESGSEEELETTSASSH